MNLNAINYLAVLTAAVACFVIGGLWYSNLMFGKAWMKESGMTEEKARQSSMLKVFRHFISAFTDYLF